MVCVCNENKAFESFSFDERVFLSFGGWNIGLTIYIYKETDNKIQIYRSPAMTLVLKIMCKKYFKSFLFLKLTIFPVIAFILFAKSRHIFFPFRSISFQISIRIVWCMKALFAVYLCVVYCVLIQCVDINRFVFLL